MVLIWMGVESRNCQEGVACVKLLRASCSFAMGRFVMPRMCLKSLEKRCKETGVIS